jgi:hypothetical protein
VVTAALLIARLALALVLLIAGVTKLADRRGSRAAMVGLGLTPSIATAFALALPLIELTAAVALFPAGTATLGAWGALILLGVFTIGIVSIMIRGVEADCHCFGQLHSARVGWRTLGRNLFLVTLAAFVAIGQRASGSPGYVNWFGGFGVVEWLVLSFALFSVSLLAVGTWFGLQLMRQHGRILLRLDALEQELSARGFIGARSVMTSTVRALPVGSPAPAFVASNLNGGSSSLRELLAPGLPLLLLFVRPNCVPCVSLIPEIARWQSSLGALLSFGVISQGSVEENRLKFAEAGLQHVLVQQKADISDAFAADMTPSAVLITQDGIVASSVAEGAASIRRLVYSFVPASLTTARPDDGEHDAAGRKRPRRDREQNVSTPLVSFDAH